MCVCVRERVFVYVFDALVNGITLVLCVCVYVCVNVCVRERECVCRRYNCTGLRVCVCVRERERECVYTSLNAWVNIITQVCV